MHFRGIEASQKEKDLSRFFTADAALVQLLGVLSRLCNGFVPFELHPQTHNCLFWMQNRETLCARAVQQIQRDQIQPTRAYEQRQIPRTHYAQSAHWITQEKSVLQKHRRGNYLNTLANRRLKYI